MEKKFVALDTVGYEAVLGPEPTCSFKKWAQTNTLFMFFFMVENNKKRLFFFVVWKGKKQLCSLCAAISQKLPSKLGVGIRGSNSKSDLPDLLLAYREYKAFGNVITQDL